MSESAYAGSRVLPPSTVPLKSVSVFRLDGDPPSREGILVVCLFVFVSLCLCVFACSCACVFALQRGCSLGAKVGGGMGGLESKPFGAREDES